VAVGGWRCLFISLGKNSPLLLVEAILLRLWPGRLLLPIVVGDSGEALLTKSKARMVLNQFFDFGGDFN